jgi:hypothetical protein
VSNPEVVHSKLSFSGRARWAACPISIHLSAGVADTSGPAAAEGTAAHTVAEFYVRQAFGLPGNADGIDAPLQTPPEGLDLKGRTVEQWNDELRQHGRAYVTYIGSFIPAGAKYRLLIEQKVAIASIHPLLFGTADCLLWLPESRTLLVIDYKYGFMKVDVGTFEHTNPQLAAYGVAAAELLAQADMSPLVIGLGVFQPRLGPSKPLWLNCAPEWVENERAKLATEVAAVEKPGAPVPGDHCRYCKGKSKCSASQNTVQTAVALHIGTRDLSQLSDDEVIALWAARTSFKAFWEDIEERVEGLVKAGHGNLVVKERQGRQIWLDAKQAALTFLAIGRTDLLQPVALSEALPALPESIRESLVTRSKPSRTITVIQEPSQNVLAEMFAKHAKSA